MPAIVHKASIFVDRLGSLAQSENDFSLQRLATDLTLDIIGDLALDTDMVGCRSCFCGDCFDEG